MLVYPLWKKIIDDRFNSWDIYLIEVEVWLKKDWFNRNVCLIDYIDLYNNTLYSQEVEKNQSINKIIWKYWLEKKDMNWINWITIEKAIKNVEDYRKWKIKYL